MWLLACYRSEEEVNYIQDPIRRHYKCKLGFGGQQLDADTGYLSLKLGEGFSLARFPYLTTLH